MRTEKIREICPYNTGVFATEYSEVKIKTITDFEFIFGLRNAARNANIIRFSHGNDLSYQSIYQTENSDFISF
jgi:hypothetical protein